MEIDLNELLLYGGISLAAAAAVMGIVFIFTMLRRRKKLSARLEKEYGKK